MERIKTALKALGYRGKVTITPVSYKRAAVYINLQLIGLWDMQRQTFVD